MDVQQPAVGFYELIESVSVTSYCFPQEIAFGGIGKVGYSHL